MKTTPIVTVVGKFRLIQFDSPSPEDIAERVWLVESGRFFDDDCPVCQAQRADGGDIVFESEWDDSAVEKGADSIMLRVSEKIHSPELGRPPGPGELLAFVLSAGTAMNLPAAEIGEIQRRAVEFWREAMEWMNEE